MRLTNRHKRMPKWEKMLYLVSLILRNLLLQMTWWWFSDMCLSKSSLLGCTGHLARCGIDSLCGYAHPMAVIYWKRKTLLIGVELYVHIYNNSLVMYTNSFSKPYMIYWCEGDYSFINSQQRELTILVEMSNYRITFMKF